MSIAIPMLDLMFFLTERQDNPRHVGAVLIFERPARGGARTTQRILDAYLKSHPVPPFNRVPDFRQPGRPVWREVDRFDMDWHVQRSVLPSPGSDAQLHEFVAALHAPMLERNRPGWQVHLVEGLERNRFAIYVKVHHALLDGESGMALLCQSLAQSPRDRRIRTLVETRLAAPVAARSSTREAGEPARWLDDGVGAVTQRGLSISLASLRLIADGFAGLRGYSADEPRAFTAPATPMNEPIRSARVLSHTTVPLARMKAVARACDATLNDVALCVLDAAMNRYLRSRRRSPQHAIVAACPVSLQDPQAKQTSTQVSILWVPLGAPSAPIGRRIRQVVASTRAAKQRLAALPRDAAYAYSVLSFTVSETLAALRPTSLGLFLPSNVLVSNVRGPAEPLYLAGARLEALCPFSTLIAGLGLNITFMSYAGQVVFGYTANASALPGAGRLARYTQDAFAALERQTGRVPLRRATAARPVA